MTNILILEDNTERIKYFKRKLINFNTYFFDNVKEAIKCINSKEIHILFLDHDLDNKTYVNSEEENTGYQFAKYIEKTGMIFETIIIHSMNPSGSEKMKKALRKSTDDLRLIPFNLLRLD